MKGIVFNVVQEIIVENQGEEAWDDLVESAGVDGSYTSLGSYHDEELVALISAAAAAGSTSPDDVMRFVGENSIPHFYDRYPDLFSQPDTMSLLLGLNAIIHPEVYKLYPGAEPPDFTYDVVEPRRLVMGYTSRRQMCAFAEGLILGAAKHFGETVVVSQATCMHRGDAACSIEVLLPDGGA